MPNDEEKLYNDCSSLKYQGTMLNTFALAVVLMAF